jgi:hydroxyethylthiazole kinase-like sugar kinase family protein
LADSKPHPPNEIEKLLAGYSGNDSELVAVRRAFVRALGGIPADHAIVAAVSKFQDFAAFVSLQLAMTGGLDHYADKANVIQAFVELRTAIEKAKSA